MKINKKNYNLFFLTIKLVQKNKFSKIKFWIKKIYILKTDFANNKNLLLKVK
jgi:hypothetical protein